MKTITPALASHLQETTTTLCTCWRIERTDGTVLGFTDHDQDLIVDGETFIASAGYFRSAIANSATTAADTMDVEGFLDDASITEDDLRYGLYDYAIVHIFVVNWKSPSDGIIKMRYGIFGEVIISHVSGLFKVELRGLTQFLEQIVGKTYQPECRVDFGGTECGIKSIPDQRSSLTNYQTGDRVVVPETTTGLFSVIPVVNRSFDVISHNARFSVPAVGAGYATNDDGTTQALDYFYYLIAVRDGTFTKYNDLKETYITDIMRIEGSSISAGQTITAKVTVYTESDWIDEEFSITIDDGAGSTDTASVAGSGTLQVTIPFSTGHDYTVSFAATNVSANPDAVSYAVFRLENHDVTVFDGTQNISVDYRGKDFIPFATDATFSVTGWTATNVLIDDWARGAQPFYGPYTGRYMYYMDPYYDYTKIGIEESYLTPTVRSDLSTIGDINFTDLDAGNYVIDASVRIASHGFGTRVFVKTLFYDNTDTFISSDETDVVQIDFPKQWKQVQLISAVPTGTRYVRFRFYGYDGGTSRQSVSIDFDDAQFYIYDSSYLDISEYSRYGGVEFVAQNDGRTGNALPSFDFTVGNSTVDGGITWLASTPKYSPIATVTSVDSNIVFYSTDLTGYADNFFDWGLVKFLTGSNKDRTIEVDSSIQATGKITSKLSFPYTIQVGDVFQIIAGCDKSRSTCSGVYNNILNFRAEPDVPGTDQYFKIAGV